MARYILAVSINSEFYREYHEHGHSEEELLDQLKGDIDDQITEYDLPQLVTRILSFEGKLETPIIVDRAVTVRNGRYSESQKQAKLQFEQEFFQTESENK